MKHSLSSSVYLKTLLKDFSCF